MKTYTKRYVLILTVLVVALFGLQAAAMAAPNFAGSWVRDNTASERVPSPIILNRPPAAMGGGGRGPGGGGPQEVITIKQDANSLQLNDPQTGYHNYDRLDGKPFTRRTEQGITNATVTATFEGDTLVIVTEQPYSGMPGNNTLHMKEVWSLSPDGKVLTITTTRTIPAMEQTYKEVYNRQ